MSVVRREIEIAAPPEEVWRYLTEPRKLAGWLMRNSLTGAVGADFEFHGPAKDGWDGVIRCKLLAAEPPHRLVFTWDANDIGGETIVSFELTPMGDGRTHLRLLHSQFENAAGDVAAIVERHQAGWAKYLGFLRLQLDEQAEGGQVTPGPVDWGRFDLHVAIAADPVDVLMKWRTVEGMESFFVHLMRIEDPGGIARIPDDPARPGDSFIWRWHSGRTAEGTYLEPEARDEVRFTFGESKVAVRALPWRGGTLLRLTQYGIPQDEVSKYHVHANCRGGWVYYLTVLKTLFEHGVDARDQTAETGASFSTYFDAGALDLPG